METDRKTESLSKEIKDIKKNQVEILEQKNSQSQTHWMNSILKCQ